MIMMDLQELLRAVLSAYRVQYLTLPVNCASPEASALDFLFRDQLYEDYDYGRFAAGIMTLVPEEGAIDFQDDFGLHYLVFRGRGAEAESYAFFGPYTYHAYGEEDYTRLIARHGLTADSIDALRWYFRRIPVILDGASWRQLFGSLLSRYLANPDLEIRRVSLDHPEELRQKPSISLSAIPYASVEARYAVEEAMLAAIRRGDITEATYQQNLFMGFTLDRRVSDPLRDVKDMIVAVNTLFRKTLQQAAVHPLYIDGISGQFVTEIEDAETEDQVKALIPKMIRHYCLAVQRHSLEKYSGPIRDCLNYIDFHYMEPLNLEGLAFRLSMNKNYLSTRFHREVGMKMTDYINQVRIQRAEPLLRKTTLSMQQIAEQCGFADSNYFARIFRRVNGATPNEYRRSVQKR